MSDRILRFTELERGDECVIGSGRCATHNVKIVRVMKDVRQKYLDENGALRWRLSETTVLECPRAFSRQTTEDCSDVSALPETVRGPMGRQKFFHQMQTTNQIAGTTI